jgi:plastocyanin
MVSGNRFSPSSLTIDVGDRIRVHNGDGTSHTFTGSSWDTGDMGPGAVQTLRFSTAGTFDFWCTPHRGLGMTGTLTVR